MGRISTEELTTLRNYKERLAKKKIPVQFLLLFGSRARGDARADSDYDLIVVSKHFANIPWLKRSLPCYDAWDYNTGADILCYTPEEYERKKKGLNVVSIAAAEGVEI
jgi:hypothetical protein